MKAILCRAIFTLFISNLLSRTLADENIIDDIDFSKDKLQVASLPNLKRSSIAFGHDWMASPVQNARYGKLGKPSFLSDRTFSVRRDKSHIRSQEDVVPVNKKEDFRLFHQKTTILKL